MLSEHFDMFKEALLFFEDYLFEYQGYLVTGPSASPENKYRLPNGVEGNVCLSPAIDNQILRFFFNCCVDIAHILGDTSDFADRAAALASRLPPTKIGSHGQIQEWMEDYEEVEVGHRHISPLFGLYPGNEFDIRRTPELATACLRTIERRTSHAGYLDPKARDQAIGDWKGRACTQARALGGARPGSSILMLGSGAEMRVGMSWQACWPTARCRTFL